MRQVIGTMSKLTTSWQSLMRCADEDKGKAHG
jgi:hypothetical protein